MASKQKVLVHIPWYPMNSVILCFDLICARLPSWASQKSRVFQLRFYWPFPTRAASHTPHYKQLNCKRECFSVANWNNIFLINMHIHTRYISLYWVLFLTPVIPVWRVFLGKFMAAQMVKKPPYLWDPVPYTTLPTVQWMFHNGKKAVFSWHEMPIHTRLISFYYIRYLTME